MESFFSFELAENINLKNINEKYFLVCDTPLRYIEINKFLYQKIKVIISENGYAKVMNNISENDQGKMTSIVLSLVSKGYLKMKCQLDSLSVNELPFVAIIIPVKNRPQDIFDCLTSLKNVDYPKEKIEVIVIDDGSTDETPDVIRSFAEVRLICNTTSKGPAECRNIGEKEANGEILAFLDSDCTVKEDWLREIIPFFVINQIGAIGGFVDSFYNQSLLDRYEVACSSLNMGKRILFDCQKKSNFYVPSCNLFVKRTVFQEVGGFKIGMHVGEDVDFCWRMRQAGYSLLYLPLGAVYHKHRNILIKMLTRRLEYGTSEAALYSQHAEISKKFSFPLNAGLSFIFFVTGILMQNYIFFSFIFLFGIIDCVQKQKVTNKIFNHLRFRSLLLSVVRSTFAFYYYASFFLVRYYLIPLLIVGLFVTPVLAISIIFILIASIVDYTIKKPLLFYPIFVYFYVLEHIAYQTGVILGCVKNRYFSCYLPKLE